MATLTKYLKAVLGLMIYLTVVNAIFYHWGASSFLTGIVLRSFIQGLGILWFLKMLGLPAP